MFRALGEDVAYSLADAPFYRVRTVLQTQGVPRHPHKYDGILGVHDLILEQGFYSLWRGTMANIIERLLYRLAKKFIPSEEDAGEEGSEAMDGGVLPIVLRNMIVAVFTSPLDYCRLRMSADTGARAEKLGVTDCLNSTAASEAGPWALYSGFWPSVFSNSVFAVSRHLLVSRMRFRPATAHALASLLACPVEAFRIRWMIHAHLDDDEILFHSFFFTTKYLFSFNGLYSILETFPFLLVNFYLGNWN